MSKQQDQNQSNEKMGYQNKKSNSNYVGLGLCIGAAVGLLIFESVAIGAGLGLCIGAGIKKQKKG